MKSRRGLVILAVLAPVLLFALPGASRIVSTTLVTDEILGGLVAPSRIAGLSRYSRDASVSNVAGVAKQVNILVERNPEQIIRLAPDLVVSARYSQIDLKNLIRQAGIPYLELTEFQTIPDIEKNIRIVASAVGEAARGEDLIRDMRRKLETAGRNVPASRRSWKVLYWTPNEWTAGTKTTIHELLVRLGLRNAAAEAGVVGNNKISLENVIRINPDVIVIGVGYARDASFEGMLRRDPRFASLQAVRRNRILAVPSRYLLTTSQFIGDAAMELSRLVGGLPEL